MSDAISRRRAIGRIIKAAQQREPVLTPPHEAVGLVAAKPVTAFCNVPERACSVRDGYAMRSADIEKSDTMHPVTLEVTQTVRAESRDAEPVSSGTAARVLTGGLVPPEADCVLAEEDVEIDGEIIRVRTPVRPGWFIRKAGGEIALDTTIVDAGEIITPQAAAVMIRTRNTSIHVFAAPTAEVLSLGSELSDPTCCGEECDTARFPADNLVLTRSLLEQSGADVRKVGVLPDIEDRLITALSASDLPDVIITTGGTGRSERDFARAGAEAAGFTVVVDSVGIRPGRHMFVAIKGKTILFGLPGPPAAVFACFHAIALPVLRRLRGLPEPESPTMARFEEGITARPGCDWVVFCRLEHKNGALTATPLVSKAVPPMLAIAQAHGIAILKGGQGVLPGGVAEVDGTMF